jgi:hypothetical protein
MSALGQYLPKLDVRVRSALPPIATKSLTSHHVGDGPIGDITPLFKTGQLA